MGHHHRLGAPRPRVQLDLPEVNDSVQQALHERELAARMAAVEKPKGGENAQDFAQKQA